MQLTKWKKERRKNSCSTKSSFIKDGSFICKVGGALVDVGKAAVTTVAVGAASAALATAGAPVWGVVIAGMGMSWLVDKVDKDNKFTEKANNKWKVTNSLKSGINSMIKRVSGWFK